MSTLPFASIIGALSMVATMAGAGRHAPCDLAERRDELLRRAAISESDGDLLTALPRLFDRDGIYISSGLLTYRGPRGARAWLERDTLNKTSRVRMVTVGGDVSSSGEDGFTYGYLDAIRANGEVAPAWYHAYWRRGSSGAWGIVAMVRRRRADGATTERRPLRPIADRRCVEVKASVDTAAIAREIAGTDQAFSDAAAASVSEAFGNYATADVAKGGKEAAYVFGRETVRALYRDFPATGLVWQPEVASAGRGGDLGFSIGVAGSRDGTPLATGAAATGHYFTIWRRDGDGRWRYVID